MTSSRVRRQLAGVVALIVLGTAFVVSASRPTGSPVIIGTGSSPPGGPPARPAPGTYRYLEHHSERGEREVVVTIRERGADRQLEDEDDGSSVLYEWYATGRRALRSIGPNGSLTCVFDPPLQTLSLPLSNGSAWSGQTRCEPIPGRHLLVSYSALVHDWHEASLGDRTYPTWRIVTDRNVVESFRTIRGRVRIGESRVFTAVDYSPELGIAIRSVRVIHDTDFETGYPSARTITRELVSFDISDDR